MRWEQQGLRFCSSIQKGFSSSKTFSSLFSSLMDASFGFSCSVYSGFRPIFVWLATCNIFGSYDGSILFVQMKLQVYNKPYVDITM
jgi:hypothetical protein